MPWQGKLFCLFVPCMGTALALLVALGTAAPYLTRFDSEGITRLSETGWKREPWKDVSSVAIVIVPGTKGRLIRVALPYYFLDFSADMFVRPEEVARTLQAEVVRHKKLKERAQVLAQQ